MEISNLEKEQLIMLYKTETGNSIEGPSFRITEYIAWLEHKLITLLNGEL